MTKYNIYQNGVFIGHTTNQTEMQSYVDSHPGIVRVSTQELPEGTAHSSTLPAIQENGAKPDGDFLRQ